MNSPKLSKDARREYDRWMLISAVASIFRAVMSDKRKRSGYRVQNLANALGVDKSHASRQLSTEPNWRLTSLSDFASALNLDIEITARDRETGVVFGPAGVIARPVSQAALSNSALGLSAKTNPIPKSGGASIEIEGDDGAFVERMVA